MKRVSLIQTFSFISNFKDSTYNENNYKLKSKFDKLLFVYLYFFNILLKQSFLKKIEKLLRLMLHFRYHKHRSDYRRYKKLIELRTNNKFISKNKLHILKKKMFFPKRRKVYMRIVSKRVFCVLKKITKYNKKKIIFFVDFLKKFNSTMNIKNNNTYLNFLSDLISKVRINNKKYNIFDKLLHTIKDTFSTDPIKTSKFFRFKFKKSKHSQLIKIILFLKKSFTWKFLDDLKSLFSLTLCNNSTFVVNSIELLYKINFKYLDLIKSLVRYYVGFIINNKIHFILKKKLIIFFNFLIRKSFTDSIQIMY